MSYMRYGTAQPVGPLQMGMLQWQQRVVRVGEGADCQPRSGGEGTRVKFSTEFSTDL